MQVLMARLRVVVGVMAALAVLACAGYALADLGQGGGGHGPAHGSFQKGSPSERGFSAALRSLAFSTSRAQGQQALSSFVVCGTRQAPSSPYVIPSASSILFVGGRACPNNPILATGTALADLTISRTASLMLRNLGAALETGSVGQLVLNSGAIVSVTISSQFQPVETAVVQYPLLTSTGVCPDLEGAISGVTGCPTVDSVTEKVGSYTCEVVSDTTAPCIISVNVTGPLSSQASTYVSVAMACGATSQDQFKLVVADIIKIPSRAIVVTFWDTVGTGTLAYFTILGDSQDKASTVLGEIYQSMNVGGTLHTVFCVVCVSMAIAPNPALDPLSAAVVGCLTPAPVYPPAPVPAAIPTLPILLPPRSTSNPALLALLTLLVIPLAICLGLICSYARRPQCPYGSVPMAPMAALPMTTI